MKDLENNISILTAQVAKTAQLMNNAKTRNDIFKFKQHQIEFDSLQARLKSSLDYYYENLR